MRSLAWWWNTSLASRAGQWARVIFFTMSHASPRRAVLLMPHMLPRCFYDLFSRYIAVPRHALRVILFQTRYKKLQCFQLLKLVLKLICTHTLLPPLLAVKLRPPPPSTGDRRRETPPDTQ